MIKKMQLSLIVIGLSCALSVATAAKKPDPAAPTADPVQALNDSVQKQLIALNTQQQTEIQKLNTKMQDQLKKVNDNLSSQIMVLNTQSQAQIKALSDSFNKQIQLLNQTRK